MIDQNIKYRVFDAFDEEQFSPVVWNNLLSKGNSDVIFMTWHWQKVWWEVFGRGKLLLITAEQEGKPIAIAPLFADEGMIFFVGSGGSDYLDFIGDVSNEEVLENMLLLAAKRVTDFLGFRFYHIPGSSPTHIKLTNLAERQHWFHYNEGELPSPILELKKFPEQAAQSSRKKSLLRHEAWFKRNGGIEVQHFKESHHILPYLEEFFEQHIARWAQTPFPSLFLKAEQRLFFTRLSGDLTETGWLRFTRVAWQQKSVAFHFGFNYKGSFLWYKPSFDISLALHSPGEVLLRNLLLLAQKEEAHTFDLGLGDEPFKQRFSTSTPGVLTCGVYPQSSVKQNY